MISKTKITQRTEKKKDSEIVETIREANKHDSWRKVAQKVSAGRRNYDSINLKEIDSQSSEGDTLVIVGKVLGTGDLTKKLRICALGFSKRAVEKMKLNKSEVVRILEEIKKNPRAEGVKFI